MPQCLAAEFTHPPLGTSMASAYTLHGCWRAWMICNIRTWQVGGQDLSATQTAAKLPVGRIQPCLRGE
jgi:hypothetical protein